MRAPTTVESFGNVLPTITCGKAAQAAPQRLTTLCARLWNFMSGPKRYVRVGNDDAILRWNTCARTIMRNQAVRPLPFEEPHPILSE